MVISLQYIFTHVNCQIKNLVLFKCIVTMFTEVNELSILGNTGHIMLDCV